MATRAKKGLTPSGEEKKAEIEAKKAVFAKFSPSRAEKLSQAQQVKTGDGILSQIKGVSLNPEYQYMSFDKYGKPIDFDSIAIGSGGTYGVDPAIPQPTEQDEGFSPDLAAALEGRFVFIRNLSHTSVSKFGVNSSLRGAVDRSPIGKIASPNNSYFKFQHYCIIVYSKGEPYAGYPIHYRDIQILPSYIADYTTALEFVGRSTEEQKAKYKEKYEEIKGKMENLLVPDLVPFDQIDWMERKPQLQFTNSIVQFGVFSEENNKFIKYETYRYEQAEERLRRYNDNIYDLVFSLPKQWTDYTGYGETEVIRWVDFVNGLGIDISLIYDGLGEIEDHKQYPEENLIYKLLSSGKSPLDQITSHNILTQNQYYKIRMNENESSGLSCFAYDLMISLYHHSSYWLPGLVLQMYDILSDKATKWEILLMALMNDNNNVFSGMYLNKSGCALLNPFSEPNNNFQRLLGMLQAGYRLDQILELNLIPATDYAKMRNLATDKQFNQLYELFKKVKYEQSESLRAKKVKLA